MVVVDLTFLCALPESGGLRLLGFFWLQVLLLIPSLGK